MFAKRLRTVYDQLTATERRIANFLRDNVSEGKRMTSYELAETLGVGQSTIIRFSKKLGYQSFRELQMDLASTNDVVPPEEISVNESTNSTNYKIMKQYQDIVNLTYAQNSEETIDQAVDYLKNARRIVIFGVGNSNLFAAYLANQLTKIGLCPYCSPYAHLVYTTLSQMGPDDLLILISESGETYDVIKSARIAQEQGIPILAITRLAKNRLYDYAALVLKTVNSMSRTRLEAMTIRCSQLCIIDMLYLNLYKTDYEKYAEHVEKSEALREGQC